MSFSVILNCKKALILPNISEKKAFLRKEPVVLSFFRAHKTYFIYHCVMSITFCLCRIIFNCNVHVVYSFAHSQLQSIPTVSHTLQSSSTESHTEPYTYYFLCLSWDRILGHKFNKRLEPFAQCYSLSLLLADFKEHHILPAFKNPCKNLRTRKLNSIYE
jgi:hypothetical protein